MAKYVFDLDLDRVTFVLELDLDMVKTCILKIKFLAPVVQKLYPEETDRQKHRYTDSTEIIYLPHT